MIADLAPELIQGPTLLVTSVPDQIDSNLHDTNPLTRFLSEAIHLGDDLSHRGSITLPTDDPLQGFVEVVNQVIASG
jgi:hypothetical protein